MWDDIIIGKGNKGTSATLVFDIEGNNNISENNVSYWISDGIFEIGMTIFKNTPEGKKLDWMIKDKVGLSNINNWIDELIIKKI